MYRTTLLNNGAEFFDPATGNRIHIDAPPSLGLRQQAPRSVQFSLTNHCNLACSFCSRPVERPSNWTVESALELLADLDRLGVAEVAFGGGEPLVFRGLFELVDRLTSETRLAVHLTTNGVLLDEHALQQLVGKVGEIRLSLYEDNDWRSTLQRLQQHGARFGVNQIVTPDGFDLLPARLHELESLGCRDVLLLPAVGQASMELTPSQAQALAVFLHERPNKAVIKLGVCWGPHLSTLPRLFPPSDCGAGHAFVEITSDRHIRPCSFHAEALPFETATDAVAVWTQEQQRLSAKAGCTGCPRKPSRAAHASPPAVRTYNAFASNNSGSYTLLGSFKTSERATEITAILNQLATDMEEDGDDNPVKALLHQAGIQASDEVAGYDDWPDLSFSNSPEAVAVDRQVWWYCDYTISMPSELGHWFYTMGGKVQIELDHSHHPLLASITLWPDLPWKERMKVDLQPMLDAIRLGPLAGEGIQARIRPTGFGVEVLWIAPQPATMRELAATARKLGFQLRLTLTESLQEAPDLDTLW